MMSSHYRLRAIPRDPAGAPALAESLRAYLSDRAGEDIPMTVEVVDGRPHYLYTCPHRALRNTHAHGYGVDHGFLCNVEDGASPVYEPVPAPQPAPLDKPVGYHTADECLVELTARIGDRSDDPAIGHLLHQLYTLTANAESRARRVEEAGRDVAQRFVRTEADLLQLLMATPTRRTLPRDEVSDIYRRMRG